MPTLTTDDGVRLHYEESGSGTPVVFVHEFAGDWRTWEPQLRHFSRRYRCIAYNARGYPPSEVPADAERYSQQRARDDILSVLDVLGLPRAHIVGNSMGGFATLHFGMAYSARAMSLVVAGCGYGAHPSQYAQFQAQSRELAKSMLEKGMAHVAATYGHGPSRLQLKEKDPRGFAEFVRQFSEHSAQGSANTMLGYQARRPSLYDLTADMARITAPTLIVAGDEDDAVLEPSLLMKRTIPTAGLVVLPKSGHMTNLEDPALFNRLLEDFFHQVESGRWGPKAVIGN
ncbi:MAG TPA: alpha/beta hydrolase [Burkholderiales bacterium]|nr:alpha/beta hydrolase [Burkholderiales bacterium]